MTESILLHNFIYFDSSITANVTGRIKCKYFDSLDGVIYLRAWIPKSQLSSRCTTADAPLSAKTSAKVQWKCSGGAMTELA
jgi:hypothetical protein